MAVVDVKGIRIGEGIPKICVPIVGDTLELYLTQAKNADQANCDMIELRVDYYSFVHEQDKVRELVDKVCKIVTKPVLFTFRSLKEGGERDFTTEQYKALYEAVIKEGLVDMIDLELSLGESILKPLISMAKEKKIKVILSNHDFHQTPPMDTLVERLVHMQQLGADIAKIAVMPQTKRDVLTLMEATLYMQEHHAYTPVVGISMGQEGAISRYSGQWMGSAITFGVVDQASAPGQLTVNQLKKLLKELEQ